MKLIIAGATGYTATELIRQSLRRPEVTSVVALARKATPVPSDIAPGSSDAAKFTSVVVKDYEGPYDADDRVKTALAGADACIWTVAITPSKSSAYPFDEVRRVCQTSTLAGLRAIYAARGGSTKTSPFRFMYMSGIAAERDQTKTPSFKPEYTLMRGETENQVLAYAAEHKPDVEAIIVKPGLITSGRVVQDWIMAPLLGFVAGVPSIPLTVLASVMLDAAINGAKTDTLMHQDMSKIGKELVESGKSSS
ncbi:hypothetical protein SPBR_05245 [Sporothrix brasiliensis 5110]|uniref:NAD(P)-binding domain-containing protein n=1 Tax=Sporothrix brasiliensis 5110 TaxID=1398154 RepID=A0A0C2IL25_9PEZI|nr:uncharacterized protein SPBR_05245 [Sporothrix brasiliensis 5110]KIH87670.1 hypothetical protein SPBR_05245 [Sporothrix brasiliensis 5110]